VKKLSLFAIAFLTTTIAGAQIQPGIKGGLNRANSQGSPSEPGGSFKFRINFNAGGLAYIPLNSKFGLQPEAMYSGQGFRVEAAGATVGKLHAAYINVPILLKYKTSSGFFIEAGPQAGFLLNAKVLSFANSMVDVTSSYKSTDFSAVFGLGYLSFANIGIDARYNLGLTNIIKDISNGQQKNNVIQIGIFYAFGGDKK